MLALRGTSAILFGLLTFLMPGITLIFLLILLAGYCFLDGIFALLNASTISSTPFTLPSFSSTLFACCSSSSMPLA
jgi:uncharacterized membrane protein HdeD (DUF308 family)